MNLRVIPTNVHGAVDHALGPTVAAAPAIFRLRKDSPEGLVAEVTGGLSTIYANLTDYELSPVNAIPMRIHLALDMLSGAALAAVPHLTGARRRGLKHWLPHTVIGAFEIGLAAFTRPEPPRSTATRAKRVLDLRKKLF